MNPSIIAKLLTEDPEGPKIKRALGLGESESQLQIASMISEDPDVMDASQISAPMSTSDIERQAEAETGDDPEAEVKDDIRKQEEEERKEREERRRVLQPQIDQINKSIQDLETGLKTGIEATRNLGDLDNQISKIAQSVGGIEKQIY
ncbi:hypothetical protein N9045_00740 [bacterium]|nr:hypothetical protein [bacterium]